MNAFAGPVQGATTHVPADHPTIQAAIDSAQPEDEIIVAPGIYWNNAAAYVRQQHKIAATGDGCDEAEPTAALDLPRHGGPVRLSQFGRREKSRCGCRHRQSRADHHTHHDLLIQSACPAATVLDEDAVLHAISVDLTLAAQGVKDVPGLKC